MIKSFKIVSRIDGGIKGWYVKEITEGLPPPNGRGLTTWGELQCGNYLITNPVVLHQAFVLHLDKYGEQDKENVNCTRTKEFLHNPYRKIPPGAKDRVSAVYFEYTLNNKLNDFFIRRVTQFNKVEYLQTMDFLTHGNIKWGPTEHFFNESFALLVLKGLFLTMTFAHEVLYS